MSATPLILYRNLGPNYDPLWGQGKQNYLTDINAVGQAILTRLLLFQGEWWSDTGDGTPWFQNILGKAANVQQISLLLEQRILGTPYVTGLVSLTVNFTPPVGPLNFTAIVQTSFGTLSVTNLSTPPNQALQGSQ
jgi:hypothetical protein